MTKIWTASAVAVLILGGTVAPAATVVNGDFEDELSVGWTVDGTQAELKVDLDEDPDNELLVFWHATTAFVPPVYATDETTVSQTILLDDLEQWFTFRFKALASHEFGAGTGFAYAEVKVSLLDEQLDELANRVYTDELEWTTAFIDLDEWIASETIDSNQILYLKITAATTGTAPAKPGYSASASVDLDNVMFVDDPGAGDTWTVY